MTEVTDAESPARRAADVVLAVMQNDLKYIREAVVEIKSLILTDHEKRLRSLEGSDRRWGALAVVLSVLMALAIKYILP